MGDADTVRDFVFVFCGLVFSLDEGDIKADEDIEGVGRISLVTSVSLARVFNSLDLVEL